MKLVLGSCPTQTERSPTLGHIRVSTQDQCSQIPHSGLGLLAESSGAGPRRESQTDNQKSHKRLHPPESPSPSGTSEDKLSTVVSDKSVEESSSDSESDDDVELTGPSAKKKFSLGEETSSCSSL